MIAYAAFYVWGAEIACHPLNYVKADLELSPLPRVPGHARGRKDWVTVSSELAQDRWAWSASVWDVVNAIGDAGSTRPEWMLTQVQVSK